MRGCKNSICPTDGPTVDLNESRCEVLTAQGELHVEQRLRREVIDSFDVTDKHYNTRNISRIINGVLSLGV